MLYVKEIINHKIGDNTSFKSLADELGWTITLSENEVEQSEIDGHLYEKGFAPKKTAEEILQEKKAQRNQEILSKVKEIELMALSDLIKGNTVKDYKQVAESLLECMEN